MTKTLVKMVCAAWCVAARYGIEDMKFALIIAELGTTDRFTGFSHAFDRALNELEC